MNQQTQSFPFNNLIQTQAQQYPTSNLSPLRQHAHQNQGTQNLLQTPQSKEKTLGNQTLVQQKNLLQQQQNMHQQCCPASQLQSSIIYQSPNGRQNKCMKNGQQSNFEVYMRCVTWSRDSHGLFDYESRYINKKNIKTQTGGRIIRVGNDVEFVSINTVPEEINKDAKPLIVVRQKGGKFYIENDTLVDPEKLKSAQVIQEGQDGEDKKIDEDINNKMFVVVRNMKSATSNVENYKLNKGDTIKLGRIKFNVKDFRTCTQPSNSDLAAKAGRNIIGNSVSPIKACPKDDFNHQHDYSLEDEFAEEAIEIDCGAVDCSKNPDIQCKICWGNENTVENPLLNSCKCDGSVRYIHYECLKYWLKQKMQKKEEKHLTSYTWKQFECEICKKPYPYVFKSNGHRYRLVDVDLPQDKNFLWLESLTFEKNSSRMVHIIMPDQQRQEFKLGRGHESDVRVSDISVSRCHAILKYNFDSQCYYLEDNLSKFGTLCLANQDIELEPDHTKAVQIGRSVISFTVKQQIVCPNPIQQEYKTPSPIKIQQNNYNKSQPQAAKMKENFMEVEEILRKKIQETNQKINKLMNSALQQQTNHFQSFQQQNQLQVNFHPQQQTTALQESQPLGSQQQEGQVSQFNLPNEQQINTTNTVQHQSQQVQQSQNQQNQNNSNLSNTLMNFQNMIRMVEQQFQDRQQEAFQQNHPQQQIQIQQQSSLDKSPEIELQKTQAKKNDSRYKHLITQLSPAKNFNQQLNQQQNSPVFMSQQTQSQGAGQQVINQGQGKVLTTFYNLSNVNANQEQQNQQQQIGRYQRSSTIQQSNNSNELEESTPLRIPNTNVQSSNQQTLQTQLGLSPEKRSFNNVRTFHQPQGDHSLENIVFQSHQISSQNNQQYLATQNDFYPRRHQQEGCNYVQQEDSQQQNQMINSKSQQQMISSQNAQTNMQGSGMTQSYFDNQNQQNFMIDQRLNSSSIQQNQQQQQLQINLLKHRSHHNPSSSNGNPQQQYHQYSGNQRCQSASHGVKNVNHSSNQYQYLQGSNLQQQQNQFFEYDQPQIIHGQSGSSTSQHVQHINSNSNKQMSTLSHQSSGSCMRQSYNQNKSTSQGRNECQASINQTVLNQQYKKHSVNQQKLSKQSVSPIRKSITSGANHSLGYQNTNGVTNASINQTFDIRKNSQHYSRSNTSFIQQKSGSGGVTNVGKTNVQVYQNKKYIQSHTSNNTAGNSYSKQQRRY